MNGIIYAIIGVSIATLFSGIGSARGVGSAAQTAMGVLSEDSSMFGKMLVLTLLPGTQGLYGFIVGFLILINCGVLGGTMPTIGQGLAYLGASLAIGFGGMFSAFAQGKAAVSGITMTAKDEKNFSKAMVSVTLVEIYALLAFIVSLLLVISVPSLNI
ncbi:MAG: V-type ATP synthase subunit K [Clostridia bacterium]|nr:V-type ATP synthase subunit K [Clostridia bacterium]